MKVQLGAGLLEHLPCSGRLRHAQLPRADFSQLLGRLDAAWQGTGQMGASMLGGLQWMQAIRACRSTEWAPVPQVGRMVAAVKSRQSMLARNRTKAREALRLALAVAHGGVEVGLHGDQLPGVLQLRGKAAAATCTPCCSYPRMLDIRYRWGGAAQATASCPTVVQRVQPPIIMIARGACVCEHTPSPAPQAMCAATPNPKAHLCGHRIHRQQQHRDKEDDEEGAPLPAPLLPQPQRQQHLRNGTGGRGKG